MHLWQDGLLALLAAIGLASLLWLVVRSLFFSRPRPRGNVIALIPAYGDGAQLEEQVRSLAALGRETGCFSRILLADCGLNEEAGRSPIFCPGAAGCACAAGRTYPIFWAGTTSPEGSPPGPCPQTGETTKEQAA